MTRIRMLVTAGQYQAGKEYDVPTFDEFWSRVRPTTYVVLSPTAETPQPEKTETRPMEEGRVVDLDSPEFSTGVILDTDVPVEFTLLSSKITEYTYNSDNGEFQRYELSILYDGMETTIRVPASVVAMIKRAVIKNNLKPVEEKKPRFVISKSGAGIKTKYSVNLLGISGK